MISAGTSWRSSGERIVSAKIRTEAMGPECYTARPATRSATAAIRSATPGYE
jgi:hypothetical protein